MKAMYIVDNVPTGTAQCASPSLLVSLCAHNTFGSSPVWSRLVNANFVLTLVASKVNTLLY